MNNLLALNKIAKRKMKGGIIEEKLDRAKDFYRMKLQDLVVDLFYDIELDDDNAEEYWQEELIETFNNLWKNTIQKEEEEEEEDDDALLARLEREEAEEQLQKKKNKPDHWGKGIR
jgi:hypothetical protein